MQFRSILILTSLLIGSARLYQPGEAQEHAAEQTFRKALKSPLGPKHHHLLLYVQDVQMTRTIALASTRTEQSEFTTTGFAARQPTATEREDIQLNATAICAAVDEFLNMSSPICNTACLGMFRCIESMVEAVDERTPRRFDVSCSRCDNIEENFETFNGPRCLDGELEDLPAIFGCAGDIMCLQDTKDDYCFMKNFTTERREICEDGCAYRMVNLINSDRCKDAFHVDDFDTDCDDEIEAKDICRYDGETGRPCADEIFDQTIEVDDACANEPFLQGFYNNGVGTTEDDCEIESAECRRQGNAYLASGGCCAREFAERAECESNVDLMECSDDFPALDVDRCPTFRIGGQRDSNRRSTGIALNTSNFVIAALISMLRFY